MSNSRGKYYFYPLNCPDCNEVVGRHEKIIIEKKRKGISDDQILKELGITKPCCQKALRNPSVLRF